jgi:RNA polymerase sigma-70 factor (ECF subfamily)
MEVPRGLSRLAYFRVSYDDVNEKLDQQGTLEESLRLARSQAASPAFPVVDSERYEQQQKALRRAQEGDEEAFRWLMETHQKQVFRLAMRMLGSDRGAAADISQEVFLRAFRGIEGFDGRRALFGTWLQKITMNLCISEYRRRKALKRDRPTYSLDAPIQGQERSMELVSDAAGPQDRAHGSDLALAVNNAIQQLPPEYRECVLLRDMQGMSYEEVAETLDLVPGTVRSRIHRGRLILQKLLKEFTP